MKGRDKLDFLTAKILRYQRKKCTIGAIKHAAGDLDRGIPPPLHKDAISWGDPPISPVGKPCGWPQFSKNKFKQQRLGKLSQGMNKR